MYEFDKLCVVTCIVAMYLDRAIVKWLAKEIKR